HRDAIDAEGEGWAGSARPDESGEAVLTLNRRSRTDRRVNSAAQVIVGAPAGKAAPLAACYAKA
ncbi:hypothetical protein WKW80_34915, partial [Variovorax humicola]